jgi:hypothetical protein
VPVAQPLVQRAAAREQLLLQRRAAAQQQAPHVGAGLGRVLLQLLQRRLAQLALGLGQDALERGHVA